MQISNRKLQIMKSYLFLLLISLIIVLSSACVSKKKYLEMEVERNHFQDKADELREVNSENKKLETELRSNESQLRRTTRELEQVSVFADQLEKDNKDLLTRYNQLLKDNKEESDVSATEKLELEEALSEKELELDEKERELEALEYILGEREGSMEEMREDLISREERVKELEDLLNSKDAQMNQLKKNLQEAISGFSASDLSVQERNGKIYVSLSSDLLFKSGSDKIDWKGKNAIKQLAAVMIENDEIEITVEGHTDNKGSADLNWDLSVKRATSVVKVLTANGVDPSRIVASGRALYNPLLPNDTEANRSKNRRTEIILSPQLDKLYDILN